MGIIRSLFQSLLINPFGYSSRNCLLCGTRCGSKYICVSCQKSLTGTPLSNCGVCGRYTLEKVRPDYICEECRDQLPPFYMARSIGPYRGMMKDWIYAFKYQRKRPLALYLANQMGGIFLKEHAFWDTELLIPVPLSKNKEMQRGFNQSYLLAEELGKFLRIKVEKALIRNYDTTRQSQLTRQERIRNMKGIFSASFPVCGKKIVLVDDIFTTGATVTECTRVLLREGALKVGVLTAASGIRQKN